MGWKLKGPMNWCALLLYFTSGPCFILRRHLIGSFRNAGNNNTPFSLFSVDLDSIYYGLYEKYKSAILLRGNNWIQQLNSDLGLVETSSYSVRCSFCSTKYWCQNKCNLKMWTFCETYQRVHHQAPAGAAAGEKSGFTIVTPIGWNRLHSTPGRAVLAQAHPSFSEQLRYNIPVSDNNSPNLAQPPQEEKERANDCRVGSFIISSIHITWKRRTGKENEILLWSISSDPSSAHGFDFFDRNIPSVFVVFFFFYSVPQHFIYYPVMRQHL